MTAVLTDPVAAPVDYEMLHRTYYAYVCGLVGQQGIPSDRREDVASDILLRFMERDFLNPEIGFDPTHTFVRGGEVKTARFKSFLNAFVISYVRGHRDRINNRSQRERLILDAHQAFPGGVTFIDVIGPVIEDDVALADVFGSDFVSRFRDYLVTVPKRSSADRCDLVLLFDLICRQVEEDGKITTKVLQERFGVSSSAISSWISVLRRHVREFQEA